MQISQIQMELPSPHQIKMQFSGYENNNRIEKYRKTPVILKFPIHWIVFKFLSRNTAERDLADDDQRIENFR